MSSNICRWCYDNLNGVTVNLPCGKEVCKRHLENKVCRACFFSHPLDLSQVLSLDSNKQKFQVKLEKNLEKLETYSNDPEYLLDETYQDLVNKIDLRREELKMSIDEYCDKLLEKVLKEKKEKLEKAKILLEQLSDQEIMKEKLSSKKISLEDLDLIDELNKKFETYEWVIKKPSSFDLHLPSKKVEIENYFGNLEKLKEPEPEIKYIPVPISNEPSKFSDNFEGERETEFNGHRCWVRDVKKLDERRIISCSSDKTVRIWNHYRKSVEKVLSGIHSSDITSIAVLAPNIIATSSCDEKIKLVNIQTDTIIRAYHGHKDTVWMVKKVDNHRILSCSDDETIKLWNSRNGKCIKTFDEHEEGVNCILVLDRGLIASGSKDCNIKIWNMNSGYCLKTLEGHTNYVMCLEKLKNGNLVSGSNDFTIKIWDIDSGHCLRTLMGHGKCLQYLLVTQCGTEIISCADDGKIKFWSIRNGECTMTINAHSEPLTSIALLENGRLASCSTDNKIKIWR